MLRDTTGRYDIPKEILAVGVWQLPGILRAAGFRKVETLDCGGFNRVSWKCHDGTRSSATFLRKSSKVMVKPDDLLEIVTAVREQMAMV